MERPTKVPPASLMVDSHQPSRRTVLRGIASTALLAGLGAPALADDDAPASAHVKRSAQESFEPEAFVLRRSMPFSEPGREGLVFVAFGRSFDAFEAILGRMVGAEDGVTDALFRFTQPISGRYFFCPPVRDGLLDLASLGL